MIRREQNSHELLRYIWNASISKSSRLAQIAAKKEEEMSQEENDILCLTEMICLMKASGEKVFSVDDDLIKLLRVTDLTKLPSDVFTPPFQCQFFSCRFGETEKEYLTGFYLYYASFDDDKGIITEAQDCEMKPGSVLFSILPVGVPKQKSNDVNLFPEIRIALPKGKDILNVIDERFTFIDDESKARCVQTLKMAFNLVLHVNSTKSVKTESWSDVDSKIDKLSGREKERRKFELRQKYILCNKIGEGISLDGKLRAVIQDAIRHGDKSLTVRFLVRGHWRHQWMGSDTQDNRRQELKWIQPFWKGDPLAEVSNKPYHLVAP